MMKKGTQAMLDSAKDDATLLPFDTVFVTKNTSNSFGECGVKIARKVNKKCAQDDRLSVRFAPVNTHQSGETFAHIKVENLLPAKKTKPKKWQNGTQSQLDAAKDDARLIPKKTYFRSKYGETEGLKVYRVDSPYNDRYDMYMMTTNDECDYHNASGLEPIND
jgi:hypothetical protein